MNVNVKLRATDAHSLLATMLGSVQNFPPNKGPSIIQQQSQQSQLVQPQQPQNGPTDVPPPPLNGQDFTLSNVLHFLQSEWRKYERDRNEWEIERAEMRVRQHYLVLPFHFVMFFQARIALLEGERRSFENIKVDLMRRIKMLEYALRVERSVPNTLLYCINSLTRFLPSSSKQLSQTGPLSSQSIPPTKVASLQSTSQKDETSSHKEGSSPSSPRSEGITGPIHLLLLLTRSKILPYPQKGDQMAPPPLIRREQVHGQGRRHHLGGQVRMAQPRPQAWANHRLAVTLKAVLAAGTTSNSTP